MNRQLSPKQVFQPAQESFKPSRAMRDESVVIGAATFLFDSATCCDLFRSPPSCPVHLSLSDPIVRSTDLLPIPDRRAERRPFISIFKAPLGRAERRPNLRAAAAGAEVRRSAEFLGYIKDAGFEILRHKTDALQPNFQPISDAPTILRSNTSNSRLW
jgi:hypothetical protein